MAWFILAGVVIAVALALVLLGKLPRAAWEVTGAALLLGIAGYAWQANPGAPGQPTEPVEKLAEVDQNQIQKERKAMGSTYGDVQAWIVLADAQSRQGKFASAAAVLRQGLKDNPEDPDLWVSLGSALMGHSNGMLTPAAQFAFQKAASIDPNHPAPPFFMGLALATSGRLEEARSLWQELLDRSPENAEWRPDLESRLARIDALIGQAAPAVPGAATPAPSADAPVAQ
ncbi:MAG: tetratricopeptide repeat protein [Blastomonas sp.]